jgi:uncharacterized membrane protein
MVDRRISVDLHAGGFALTSRRNCSMSPHRLLAVLGALAFVNLAIGTAFAALGLWMVLPFAGIEAAALAVAFWMLGRHAGDYERVVLVDGRLRVEMREAEALRHYEFNPAWVSVVVGRRAGSMRLALRSHGKEIEIGRHLDATGRERFAALLRERLAGV